MVAQFLRLKLRLLANIFRRSPWQVVGIVVGLVYGLGVAALLFASLVGLRFVDDVELIRDVFIVAGAATVVGFVVFPLVFGVDDTMDPRRFALFGLRDRTLAVGLALAAAIGIPALVLGIVLAGTVVTWSRGVGQTLLALVAAAIAFATCLLLARVATSLASVLLATRRAREVSGVLGILLIVLISPIIVVLVTLDWANSGLRVLESLAGVLGWTPLGAAFAAPGDAAAGAWGPAVLKLLLAGVTLGVIWLVWQALVAKMLVTPGREASAKNYRGLGWFDRVPHTASGAVAARSLTYWFRDARYWVSILMVPVVPLLVIVPLGLAGIPLAYTALIPVPLMCLFLGWSLHNDTAYDSTAIWLHIASGVRGSADRTGRLVPVIIAGVLVIGLGSAVTVFVIDDWRLLPSLVGVSTALLFAGLGVGSITSARFPYPAVKPGDSPFQQPQSTGTVTALVQSITMLGSLVVALPAVAFAALGMFVDPAWHAAAFAAGVGLGVLVLVSGVMLGGRVFDRRGPEILGAALRA
jgi:ABC-2 type transport system permease protein